MRMNNNKAIGVAATTLATTAAGWYISNADKRAVQNGEITYTRHTTVSPQSNYVANPKSTMTIDIENATSFTYKALDVYVSSCPGVTATATEPNTKWGASVPPGANGATVVYQQLAAREPVKVSFTGINFSQCTLKVYATVFSGEKIPVRDSLEVRFTLEDLRTRTEVNDNQLYANAILCGTLLLGLVLVLCVIFRRCLWSALTKFSVVKTGKIPPPVVLTKEQTEQLDDYLKDSPD